MSPHSPSSRCPNLLSIGPDPCLRSLTTRSCLVGRRVSTVLMRNIPRPGLRPRVFMIRPPHLGEKRPPPPPLLIQRALPQACLLLAPPRGLREPKAPPVLLQVLYAKRSGVGGAAHLRSGVGAEGQVQEGENSSQASAAAESFHTDLLTKKEEEALTGGLGRVTCPRQSSQPEQSLT